MNRSEMWTAIDAQRQDTVELLERLGESDWQRPSLCAGWSVREVTAHLALQNTPWTALPRGALEAARHRGMNGAIRALAVRHAQLPVDRLLAEIRERIGVWRPLPTVTVHETAIDYLVHGQDIALPLGLVLPMHTELSAAAAERVWTRSRMFHARRHFRGYRLAADDSQWQAGDGPEIRGPVGALLLLLTGRDVALAQLRGPGAQRLREERGVPPQE